MMIVIPLPSRGNTLPCIHLLDLRLPFSEGTKHLHLEPMHWPFLTITERQAVSDEMNSSTIVCDARDGPLQILERPSKPGDLMNNHMLNLAVFDRIDHLLVA